MVTVYILQYFHKSLAQIQICAGRVCDVGHKNIHSLFFMCNSVYPSNWNVPALTDVEVYLLRNKKEKFCILPFKFPSF